MLRLTDITKTYPSGDVAALRGVSIAFRPNEFVSILGPSGCGKTTLLNIIGGLDQYTSGDLIICHTEDPENVQVGDVISFFDPAGNGTSIVTHRVLEVTSQDGEIAFKTKGDGNNVEDQLLVPAKNLVSVYQSRIPGAGNVAMFMQTTPGLIDTSRNKGFLFSINNELKNISKHLVNATIYSEDKNFYTHKGVSLKRIGGALINNLKSNSLSQGASTITQQYIKNTFLTSEQTYKRKLIEITYALELEKKYTKEQILEAYLNNLYFRTAINHSTLSFRYRNFIILYVGLTVAMSLLAYYLVPTLHKLCKRIFLCLKRKIVF